MAFSTLWAASETACSLPLWKACSNGWMTVASVQSLSCCMYLTGRWFVGKAWVRPFFQRVVLWRFAALFCSPQGKRSSRVPCRVTAGSEVSQPAYAAGVEGRGSIPLQSLDAAGWLLCWKEVSKVQGVLRPVKVQRARAHRTAKQAKLLLCLRLERL